MDGVQYAWIGIALRRQIRPAPQCFGTVIVVGDARSHRAKGPISGDTMV